MSFAMCEHDRARESLLRAIIGVVRAWPETDRGIFIAARYRGQSLDQIALARGLAVEDVRRVLEKCERRLYDALRGFKEDESVWAVDAFDRPAEFTLNLIAK